MLLHMINLDLRIYFAIFDTTFLNYHGSKIPLMNNIPYFDDILNPEWLLNGTLNFNVAAKSIFLQGEENVVLVGSSSILIGSTNFDKELLMLLSGFRQLDIEDHVEVERGWPQKSLYSALK